MNSSATESVSQVSPHFNIRSLMPYVGLERARPWGRAFEPRSQFSAATESIPSSWRLNMTTS